MRKTKISKHRKQKNQCKNMTNGQRMGKNKEQDIKTHNKGWTKDIRL